MKVQRLVAWLAVVVFSVGLGAGAVKGQMLGNLFEAVGGMDTVSKLASSLLSSAAKDPRLSGLLGKLNTNTATPKLTDQLCAMLGGGCKAPLSDQQITAGAKKLNDSQSKALSDNFSSALNSVSSNPLVKEGITKAIGPKLSGIVGALL